MWTAKNIMPSEGQQGIVSEQTSLSFTLRKSPLLLCLPHCACSLSSDETTRSIADTIHNLSHCPGICQLIRLRRFAFSCSSVWNVCTNSSVNVFGPVWSAGFLALDANTMTNTSLLGFGDAQCSLLFLIDPEAPGSASPELTCVTRLVTRNS